MYNSSMFASIKEALAKSEKSSSGSPLYKEILRFKAGNTYVLRLLPNIKDPANTFYHYYQHGWESFCSGEYVSTLSLQTIGKPDPISIATWRIKKSGSEEDKKKVEAVKWSEQWFVNVYVVDDPVNPENNGSTKIFRFGRKLHKMIDSAINGDDSDEFGARVFDLGATGVNLKLRVEKQGDYITYDSSRFTSPNDLNLSTSRVEEIYNSIHDLTSVNQLKSEEEIIDLWNKHFVCNNLSGLSEASTQAPVKQESVYTAPASTNNSVQQVDEISDEEVQNILKGFDN